MFIRITKPEADRAVKYAEGVEPLTKLRERVENLPLAELSTDRGAVLPLTTKEASLLRAEVMNCGGPVTLYEKLGGVGDLHYLTVDPALIEQAIALVTEYGKSNITSFYSDRRLARTFAIVIQGQRSFEQTRDPQLSFHGNHGYFYVHENTAMQRVLREAVGTTAATQMLGDYLLLMSAPDNAYFVGQKEA